MHARLGMHVVQLLSQFLGAPYILSSGLQVEPAPVVGAAARTPYSRCVGPPAFIGSNDRVVRVKVLCRSSAIFRHHWVGRVALDR